MMQNPTSCTGLYDLTFNSHAAPSSRARNGLASRLALPGLASPCLASAPCVALLEYRPQLASLAVVLHPRRAGELRIYALES